MEAPLKPLTCIIEDDPIMLEMLTDACMAKGFTVRGFSSLIEAAQWLTTYLKRSQPVSPMLVIIDQHLSIPGQPSVEGWVLAFYLRAGEQDGTLHPCWIAAISGQFKARQRRDRCEEAQCDYLIDKPYFIDQIGDLHTDIMTKPVPQHSLSDTVQELHESCIELLRFALAKEQLQAQPPSRRLWTGDDVYLILGSHSPAIRLKDRKSQAEELIQQLGGESQALQYVWKVLPNLETRQQKLLRRILRGEGKAEMYEDGYSRREVTAQIRIICEAVAGYHNAI